jgi:hypothetical protein
MYPHQLAIESLSDDDLKTAIRNTNARAEQFVKASQALRAAYSPTDGPSLMRTVHDVEARAHAERAHRDALLKERRRRGLAI